MSQYEDLKKKALENFFISAGYAILALSEKIKAKEAPEPELQTASESVQIPPQPLPEQKEPKEFASMP